MQVRIFSTAAQQILAHVAREHPREACGLLLGRESVIEAVAETVNVAADPKTAFEIDPAALLRAHREAREGGRTLLGWYHSHPNGRGVPSAADAARADETGRFWLIAAGGSLRLFRSQGTEIHRDFSELSLAVIPAKAATQ